MEEKTRSYLLLVTLNMKKPHRVEQFIRNTRNLDSGAQLFWKDSDHIGIALQSPLRPDYLLAQATQGIEADIGQAMALELCGHYSVMRDRDALNPLNWLSTHVRPQWEP